MSFKGTEGEEITLDEAAAMTAEYRAQNPGATKGHFFGKNLINTLLKQRGAEGIRIYYGINPDTGEKELVLVAADSEENDILNTIVDKSRPCPKFCGSTNALNS